MGIEMKLSEKKRGELCELPKETNTNSKSRKNRRHRQRKMLPGPRLFQTCKQVFASAGPGIIPSLQHIEMLQSVLDGIKAEDVGLKPEMPYFSRSNARRAPKVTYLHIYECEKFSMGIFCLPPSGVIPLHNHPGMTVFSKLLFGTMHIKSYDWVKINLHIPTMPAQTPEMRLAKVKVDADFSAPCNPSILYPTEGGNMHCFTAVTACAVLDVLGPPYSDPDGRHCSYYQNFPFSKFSVDGISLPEEERTAYEWLQEREKPEGFQVVGKMYSGPMMLEI
ncbi:plant cysteine oxidase 2-like isoform X2 [Gastrolobium bilobum]|uniref:plant cysteine oxidase 2-like isoform X2 n=1 Tax=Gastrolobium bilobum TaxID=150636 RepID=UPI002AB1061D|nr:plant cysteine oxidase 2-like isoform X2 [Gastrolobium bilobum]